jgi:hypothetical protein
MLLYQTALHPEFFGIEGRRRIEHGPYELEAWIFPAGHAIRFETGETIISEILTEQPEKLPQRGHIDSFQCAGERDHEAEYGEQSGSRVLYMTSMQTETLSDHLYLSTYHELHAHGNAVAGLVVPWLDDASRPNLSVLETQRFNREVHVQSYHLRSDCGLVLRTQSIFQVK